MGPGIRHTTVDKRAVCILLECFLVLLIYTRKHSSRMRTIPLPIVPVLVAATRLGYLTPLPPDTYPPRMSTPKDAYPWEAYSLLGYLPFIPLAYLPLRRDLSTEIPD